MPVSPSGAPRGRRARAAPRRAPSGTPRTDAASVTNRRPSADRAAVSQARPRSRGDRLAIIGRRDGTLDRRADRGRPRLRPAGRARGPRRPRLNLWWPGHLGPRRCSAASTQRLGRHRNAIAVLRCTDHARWAELTADEDFMVDASRVLDEFSRYMANGEDSWYRSSPERRCPDRSPTSAPSTASTSPFRSTPAAWACSPATMPGRVGRGAALHRHRPPLPARLLPPADRRRWPPGARAARSRPVTAAAATSARPRRRPAGGHRRDCGSLGPRGGVGGPGRARAGPPPRHRYAGQRQADRPITHILYVAARDAPVPGARARDRRRAGAAGARHRARPSGTSTRATRRFFWSSARASCCGRSEPRRPRRSAASVSTGLHDSYAGPGRNEIFDREVVTPALRTMARRRRAWSPTR